MLSKYLEQNPVKDKQFWANAGCSPSIGDKIVCASIINLHELYGYPNKFTIKAVEWLAGEISRMSGLVNAAATKSSLPDPKPPSNDTQLPGSKSTAT